MQKQATFGTICKVVAIAILVIGLIGAFVLAQPSDAARYYAGAEFDFGLFLTVCCGTGIFSLQIYALGEIVDHLDSIHDSTVGLYHLLSKLGSRNEQKDT